MSECVHRCWQLSWPCQLFLGDHWWAPKEQAFDGKGKSFQFPYVCVICFHFLPFSPSHFSLELNHCSGSLLLMLSLPIAINRWYHSASLNNKTMRFGWNLHQNPKGAAAWLHFYTWWNIFYFLILLHVNTIAWMHMCWERYWYEQPLGGFPLAWGGLHQCVRPSRHPSQVSVKPCFHIQQHLLCYLENTACCDLPPSSHTI